MVKSYVKAARATSSPGYIPKEPGLRGGQPPQKRLFKAMEAYQGPLGSFSADWPKFLGPA